MVELKTPRPLPAARRRRAHGAPARSPTTRSCCFQRRALEEARALRRGLRTVQHVGFGVSIRGARDAWAAGLRERARDRARARGGARARPRDDRLHRQRAARMLELAALGAGGIFTDRPDLALRIPGRSSGRLSSRRALRPGTLRDHLRPDRQRAPHGRSTCRRSGRAAAGPRPSAASPGRGTCARGRRRRASFGRRRRSSAASSSSVSGRTSTSTRSPLRPAARRVDRAAALPPCVDLAVAVVDDRRLEPVHRADELGDERRRRRAVHLGRRARSARSGRRT